MHRISRGLPSISYNQCSCIYLPSFKMSTAKSDNPLSEWNDCSLIKYSAFSSRPKWKWNNKHSIAFFVDVNLEHFSFGNGYGAKRAQSSATNESLATPDQLNWCWREYGNRCGVWRLLRLLDELNIPSTAQVNSKIAHHCPQVIEAFVQRGDEIIAHGETNSQKQCDMDYKTESEMIKNVTNVLKKYSVNNINNNINGWIGPWISATSNTLDILYDNGYKYVLDYPMDDQPIWLNINNDKRILSIPYPCELNDIIKLSLQTENIISDIDELSEEAMKTDTAYVYGIALHPYIVGYPYQLRELRKVLTHIKNVEKTSNNIWITRPGEIADYVYNNKLLPIC
eukprot:269682_1